MKGWKYRSRELLEAIIKVSFIFLEESINCQVRINKINGKRTYGQLLASPSELTSRIHPLIFHPTMVVENFQILGVKITRKYICELKSWIYLFLLVPPIKTLLQILITTLDKRKLPIFPKQCFFFKFNFPQQKGGRIIKLKKRPKLNFESVCHKFW